MQRIRARIGDRKVIRVVGLFLKAGVLEEEFLLPTQEGTPQGGVISPLLANIALTAIEERYERWVHHRTKTRAFRTCDGITAANGCRVTDRRRGVPVFFPVRYADDFVILVSGTREDAEAEKAALATYLTMWPCAPLGPARPRTTPPRVSASLLSPLYHASSTGVVALNSADTRHHGSRPPTRNRSGIEI
jgi:RNA-directed DNA polymerase